MSNIYDDVEALQTQVAALETTIASMTNAFSLTTGTAVATNEKLNGKTVYCKTIDFGTLPNATTKDVASGLTMTDIEIVRIDGTARNTTNDGTTYQLGSSTPSSNYAISCFMTAGGSVRISTEVDRSMFTGIVRIYYVYKEETNNGN